MKRRFPKIIFITGVDGSGKTYFAKRLIKELKQQGIRTFHLWLRFNNIVSKPLLGFCRIIGLNYYERYDNVVIGYHDFEKSKIVTWLFVFFQLIDVWLVTLFKIWPRIIVGKTLVCDRGVYDTLIDIMIDTKKVELYKSRLGKLFLLFIPKEHKVFYIQRNPEKIFSSRPDVKIDKNFDLRYKLYKNCSEFFHWTVVDNNGLPDETLKKILSGLSLNE